MTETEKQSVIIRLSEYLDQIDQLLAMLENLPLRRAQKNEAWQKMKALKEKLEAEFREGATARGQSAMNRYEKAFLHPAIHEAHTEINVHWNSIPDLKWHDELYSARMDVKYMLDKLDTPSDK